MAGVKRDAEAVADTPLQVGAVAQQPLAVVLRQADAAAPLQPEAVVAAAPQQRVPRH